MAISTLVKKLSIASAGVATAAGIAIATTAGANAANLVSNGGFETGNFSGWTQSGNTGFTGVGGGANSGNYAAYLGPVGSLGYLSQTLATNVGQTYNLSFFLQNDGGTPNAFQALVNGNLLFNFANLPAQGYTPYSTNFVATSSSTQLRFGFRNDPSYLHLDDVSVQSVPEPGTIAGLVALGAMGAGSALKRKQQKVNV